MELTWEETEKVSKKRQEDMYRNISSESWKRTIVSIINGILTLEDPRDWHAMWVSSLEGIIERNMLTPAPFSREDIEMLYVTMSDEAREHIRKSEIVTDGMILKKSSDIVSKPIDWLWKDKIAKGKVTLLAGDPGLGKSQTTIFLAGVVSNGGMFPGESPCKQGKVLFFSAEDDPEDTINPRLSAVGANKDNVFIFSCIKRKGVEKFFDVSKDLDLLEDALNKEPDISLIIVDPITAFLGETDSHVNAEVRALLSRLSKVASQKGIAIVVVTHLNKSTGGSPLNKITGSLAFVAAARAAYMVIKDENDESRRLFLPVKNNLADDKGGFAFKVEGVRVEDGIPTSRVVWEKEGVSMTAVEAMTDKKGVRGSSGVDEKILKKLESILQRHPDGITTTDFIVQAARMGINKHTIYKAEPELFVQRVGTGNKNERLWKPIFQDDGTVSDDITVDAVNKFNN